MAKSAATNATLNNSRLFILHPLPTSFGKHSMAAASRATGRRSRFEKAYRFSVANP